MRKTPDTRGQPPMTSGSGAGIAHFAERLREVMGTRGIRGFARKCGLSEGVLRNYLRNRTFPTLDRLEAIAAAAGKPPGWFIAENGDAVQIAQPERMPRLLDEPRLKAAIALAETALAERRASARRKAELVVLVYDLLEEGLSEAKALRFAVSALNC